MEKLDKIDASRRAALTKLVQGAAFTVPVVASFAMAGLAPTQAYAANSNVVSVPTMQEWGVGLLAAGLGATALVVMNKAKQEV